MVLSLHEHYDGPRLPVLSLEGWRNFVDAPAPQFTLMEDERWRDLALDERNAYDDARLSYHSRMEVVITESIREITKQGYLLTLLNRQEIGARLGLAISGEPTTGKTTAAQELGRTIELKVRARYPATTMHDDRIPVVYVTAPPKGSPRKLATEFAQYLGLPTPRRGYNTSDITEAVCQVLIDGKTEVVFLDEAHNLNLATSAGADMSDHLKFFMEHIPATFVLIGVKLKDSGLFDGLRGQQIAGRFSTVYTHAFPKNAEWQSLVAAMEEDLRLHSHRPGALLELTGYLHDRTKGFIGSLSQLVRTGAQLAILEGRERVDRDLLERISINHAATEAS
jgi:hypothetical protein